MEQSDTNTETPLTPPRLVRPREGRIVAGVAQGLANRFDLPVVLIRVVLALLVFGGGLGIALYAAGWFLIRSEDEAEAPSERLFAGASNSRSWIGVGLVFLAILILLDNFTFLSGGVVWAVGLLVVGVLLYTGDLPRLVNQPEADDKEGIQQMTQTDRQAPTAPSSASAPGGGLVGGGAPPIPTPTPPILPPAAHRPPRESSLLGRITIGTMLVSLGVLAILDNIASIPIDPGPRHYMALAVTVLGIGLIVGGFVGRARWLILIAVILVPTMLFSPAFEYDWSSETFDRAEAPLTFADVDNAYGMDVGRLRVDLTDLPWDGRVIDLELRVDAGSIELVLPDGVGLTGEASVDVGRVSGLGRESSGLSEPGISFNEPGELGTVSLDATVDVGNIDIFHD